MKKDKRGAASRKQLHVESDSVDEEYDEDQGPENMEKIITLHFFEKKYQVKLFEGITRQEILDHVHEILKVDGGTRLVFDDFEGNNLLLGGNIQDGTQVRVTIYNQTLALDDTKQDQTLHELLDSQKQYQYWESKTKSKAAKVENITKSNGDMCSVVKLVGWTGQALDNPNNWYKTYAMTPVLPNTGKVVIDVKIYGLAYPHSGFFGFI